MLFGYLPEIVAGAMLMKPSWRRRMRKRETADLNCPPCLGPPPWRVRKGISQRETGMYAADLLGRTLLQVWVWGVRLGESGMYAEDSWDVTSQRSASDIPSGGCLTQSAGHVWPDPGREERGHVGPGMYAGGMYTQSEPI